MNWTDWYTDTVDIYRVQITQDGALNRRERVLMYEAIPCRVYQYSSKVPTMSETAASIKQESKLACDTSVDIRPGDELIIHRGAGLGKPQHDTRAFAGDPNYYYEPFGAVIPGLAHQEINLLQEEWIK